MFDNSWFSCANELFGQTVCITWFAQHKDMPVPEFESSVRLVLKCFAESRNKWTLDDELLIWALAEFISAAENKQPVLPSPLLQFPGKTAKHGAETTY